MISPMRAAKILSVKLKNDIDKLYTKIKIFKPTVYVVSAHGGRASPRNGIFANVDVYPDLPQKF